ncbi:protein of unknown function (LPXTG-motif cell wall anchor domain) [endosymbiont DhMRE of Dentiscutata heterogama]|uniref:LPXTG cell wall anchor domain-containing protein n=1 Tax=endosymbiont DhMRE of Dentiscutata heterogama TaxID=1609546 RepID=UPI000629D586|nr:LPXTG cell wall anchor domain-containing protein [endosymbiont DhMRE of Dentiscutata heterogama]CFW93460.1 protein of unknown function (LPXTG-motif cell wall anchor domain) [endosymbiont DhMRE of Dentiscutata heterogama]
MNNNFNFYFATTESLIRIKNYTDGGQKYLVANFTKDDFCELDNPRTHLIIPDDNSLLASHVKNNPDGYDVFFTPLSNLKYRPGFQKGRQIINGLLIKDTSQVKKLIETERTQAEITFQVISQQKKIEGENPNPKNYSHELVVKPFSLGIEGIPEISRIIFNFISLLPGQTQREKGLIKTELYNSKLLAESAGKTFSMKVKRWRWGASNNSLYFNNVGDLDIGSLREISSDNQPPKPSQNDNPPSPNPPKNSGNSPPSENNWLMISGITILAVFVLGAGFLVARKRKKD